MQSDALWHPLDTKNCPEPALLQPGLADGRSRARFQIDLPFRYSAGDRAGFSGSGRVLNIGSVDVTVSCRHQLKPGMPVELVIEWPARLDGRIPIHLVMVGRVMRSDTSGFAVGCCQHRFELVGSPASDEPPEPSALPAGDNAVFCVPVPGPLPAMEIQSAHPR